MLVVIAPAKSLDFESPVPEREYSRPRLLEEAEELVAHVRRHSPDQLEKLMKISASLAEQTHQRFADWGPPYPPESTRPALMAFSGDVYQALDAPGTFSTRDFTHAQKVLRILSGLYGVLRPLDLIQAYRLEMASPLDTDRGKGLYRFWGGRITEVLRADLDQSPGPKAIVNLASDEYFSAVDVESLDVTVVTPRFLTVDLDGEPKASGFTAKRARGLMAGWIIRDRVRSLKALTGFRDGGYRIDRDRSTATRPVYLREVRA